MGKRDREQFNKLRIEFLPEALEIVEKPTAPLGNLIIWFVFLMLLVFLLWACIGKVDEVATARGQIMSDGGAQELQSAGTGIITEVKVREGQTVKKGDVLYCMDKEMEKIGIEYSEGEIGLTELKAELIEQLLLEKSIAEYRNGNYAPDQLAVIEDMIAWSESADGSLNEYKQAVENAKTQYEYASVNTENRQVKDEYLEEQRKIQEAVQGLASITSIELELLKDEYDKAVVEEEKYKTLYEAGAVSQSEWKAKSAEAETLKKQIEMKKIEIQGEELSKQGEESNMNYQIAEHELGLVGQLGSMDELKHNYDMAQLNLENAKTQRANQLREMRGQCEAQLKEYGVSLRQQYYEYENKDICAPYDGVIKMLNIGKEGAVVSSTQVVAEILPETSQLIVEAQVSNSDIGFIEIGQNVDVKVDTYDYQKYGKLEGTVIYISPDAIENQQMQKVYKVNVLLGQESEDILELSQGMECSVEIKTGRKRIIDFFLEPLTEALDSSLKER